MNEDETPVVDASNQDEIEINLDEEVEESAEDLKARLAKAEELATNYKVRAEKAEKKAKEIKPEAPQSDISMRDMFALSKANVNEDDIDEVVDYAKFKKISLSEALKSQTVQAILKEKEEKRNVANATNTGTQRRATNKLTDDALVSNASKGTLPESEEDMARLFMARKGRK